MNEYIKLQGSEDYIANQLKEKLEITLDEAYRIFYFIDNHKYFLGNDELFSHISDNKLAHKRGITFAEETYHINLKITTIVICALLLDITILNGFAAAMLSLIGFPTKGIVKISEEKGEKCILKEILRLNTKCGNKQILNQFKGECCNNDLSKCMFRDGSNCKCSSEQCEDILKGLADNNVLSKNLYGIYTYQW